MTNREVYTQYDLPLYNVEKSVDQPKMQILNSNYKEKIPFDLTY